MATVIELETGRLGYLTVLETVLTKGRSRAPRGLSTLDLGHTTVTMQAHDALPMGTGRGLSRGVAAVEALQIIAGEMDDALMVKIAPQFANYTETDGTFHGAYGRRVGRQVHDAITKLQRDPDTRQAVVTIWDPKLDNIEGKRDYPCTVAFNFTIASSRLEMHTLMRSNDAWLGFPYDIFTFTQLQMCVARALCIQPGLYTHTAWSLHLYERDLDRVEKMLDHDATAAEAEVDLDGIGRLNDDFDTIQDTASAILGGIPVHEPTVSERWYTRALAPYLE